LLENIYSFLVLGDGNKKMGIGLLPPQKFFDDLIGIIHSSRGFDLLECFFHARILLDFSLHFQLQEAAQKLMNNQQFPPFYLIIRIILIPSCYHEYHWPQPPRFPTAS
jgi:hypothetical protein